MFLDDSPRRRERAVGGRSDSRVRLVRSASTGGSRSLCSARIEIPISNGRSSADVTSAGPGARRDVSIFDDRGVPSAEQREQDEEYDRRRSENPPDPAREAPG